MKFSVFIFLFIISRSPLQAQLVQSEKMASLGEMTAVIAHEIQNPLNFVNHFSALNTELFNTIKPSGSDMGLGLSLSYDIVKAHGGEIKVASKEGEGAEFIIQLPI